MRQTWTDERKRIDHLAVKFKRQDLYMFVHGDRLPRCSHQYSSALTHCTIPTDSVGGQLMTKKVSVNPAVVGQMTMTTPSQMAAPDDHDSNPRCGPPRHKIPNPFGSNALPGAHSIRSLPPLGGSKTLRPKFYLPRMVSKIDDINSNSAVDPR